LLTSSRADQSDEQMMQVVAIYLQPVNHTTLNMLALEWVSALDDGFIAFVD
jgi:hypothetical protein